MTAVDNAIAELQAFRTAVRAGRIVVSYDNLIAALQQLQTGTVPSGAAGGDLSGNYPNPTVAKLQGRAIAATAPADGKVLKWVAANNDWEPG